MEINIQKLINEATEKIKTLPLDTRQGGEHKYWDDVTHEKADEILCNTLEKLGFTELVNIFRETDKTYEG